MKSAEKLVALLKERGKRITFAESCTGGLASAAITSVSGSSTVFDGALCSYANRIKNDLLGVSNHVLDTQGAVSAPSALQMAEGALALFAADVAVAITGIAGPDGGSVEKPVGTVFICCVNGEGNRILKRCRFAGNRDTVRAKSVEIALQCAIEILEKE